MPGYPASGGMDDLLFAMKTVPKQDQARLTYVDLYRIALGGWFWAPWDRYALYFNPVGSPETILAERDVLYEKYATHIVNIDCLVPYQNPDVEESIIGRAGSHVGLAAFVKDTLDYYEHNFLGLTGLESGYPPVCEVLEGSYQEISLEETEFYIRVATVRYEARTKPFIRTDDT